MPDPWALGLILVASLGALTALYFILVDRRVIPPDPRWLPRVCRMDDQTCATVLETRYARAFGALNATYGLAWYLAVIGASAQFMVQGTLPTCNAFLAVSAFTVAFSAYLAWALLARLETPCPLCFLGHAVNLVLLLLLLGGCGWL